MTDLSEYRISERAWDRVVWGSYPDDEPARFKEAAESATSRRRGKGRTITLTVQPSTARDLADYLDSCADATESMSSSEREGEDPRPYRRAAEELRAR